MCVCVCVCMCVCVCVWCVCVCACVCMCVCVCACVCVSEVGRKGGREDTGSTNIQFLGEFAHGAMTYRGDSISGEDQPCTAQK